MVREFKKYQRLKADIELLKANIQSDHNFNRRMQYRELKVGLESELRRNLFYKISKK